MRRMRAARMRRAWAEPDKIDNFKDAERVENEKCDEPLFLAAARRVPESKSFQNSSPDHYDDEEGENRAHEPRHEWGISGEVVHRRELYHTLLVMRYLGIDYGSSKIGLALSDEAGTMGFPYSIVPNTPRLIDDLCALIARESVGAVVIGESRDLSGNENPIAQDAQALGTLLTESGTPVFYESEVFTSAEARRAPEKERKSRSTKRQGAIDDSAAALILTSYLSRIHHG